MGMVKEKILCRKYYVAAIGRLLAVLLVLVIVSPTQMMAKDVYNMSNDSISDYWDSLDWNALKDDINNSFVGTGGFKGMTEIPADDSKFSGATGLKTIRI